MKSKPRIRGLYAIADTQYLADAGLAAAVAQAIDGGARVLQYRDKKGGESRRLRQAAELLALCRRHGVPLIVNDDAALALEVGADGVHLGREDARLSEARAQLGAAAIIGVSCYNR